MKVKVSIVLMVSILLSQLTGCSSINKRLNPIQPEVFVDAIKIENASLSGITALLTLNVRNPNDFALNARGLDYTMSMSGTNIITGESQSNMSVPALGSGAIEVPVRISYAAILETIPKVFETGVADYNFTGSIHTRLFNIPFDKTDQIKLPFLGGTN